MNKKIIFLFFCLLMILNSKTSNAVTPEVQVQLEAILETGHAYYRQGEQMQYDSYRKNLLATPEDATSKNCVYTVCSGFVFQTYYQALGIEVPDTTEELLNYAKANKENKDVVLFYYNTAKEVYSKEALGTKEQANYTNFTKKLLDVAQTGDILVITRACYAN